MQSLKSQSKFYNLKKRQSVAVLAIAGLFLMTAISAPFVYADRFQDQINALDAENGQKKEVQGQLGAEAASFSETINKLHSEINAAQNRINENEAKMMELKAQIVAAEAELLRQRNLLGQTIRAMYLEGEITTVEMLATSKDLSDYFDKQQYRESVNSKIKSTLDKITKLKLELNTQKETVEKILVEQKNLQAQLATQKAENNRLLSLNQSQQSEVDAQIKANQAKIAGLRAEQIAANKRAISSGKVTITSSGSCGGGYPASAASPWGGSWGCNYALDNTIDNWGMYNRECVSYAAWKVHQSGRHMPYGYGNANNWDNRAIRDGYVVDGNPRVGDVAVAEAGGFYGSVGHVMYVEQILGGGKIRVSQFNFGGPGQYSEMTISASGLKFIHF
ncbi:MAG: CHAP domain-containing protein [Candidatus Saccharimonadales bacterium]